MNVIYLFFFTLTQILCYVFTIPTSVSNRDSNSDHFAIGDINLIARFGKSPSTLLNGNSITSSLQRTLRTPKNFASNLYYGENQQIRGEKKEKKCGWITRLLCCFFVCCRQDNEEENVNALDESFSDANISLKDSLEDFIGIDFEPSPEDSPEDSVGIDTEPSPERDHLVRQSIAESEFKFIKKWLKSDPTPYFPSTLLEDHMIQRFYYVCGNDLPNTMDKIELFFKYRSEMPRFFTDRDPLAENLQKIMNVVYVLPLPEKTRNGQQLYIVNFDDGNVKNFDFLDFVKAYYNITDVRMKTDEEIPTGDIPIFDVSHFTMKHYKKINSSEDAKDFLQITQRANPVLLQKVHLINTSAWLRLSFEKYFAKLLKPETAEKIVLHKDAKALFKYFPDSVEVMPSDYGGKGASIAEIKEIWKNKLEQEENRDWLMSNPWRVDDPIQPPQES